MKFKLLSIGQKFEYKGETFVKASPLIASNIKTSENKIIPFSAALVLLDDSGLNQQQIQKEMIPSEEILKAFNVFYETCIRTLDKKDVLIPEIKNELDKARDVFIQHLV